MSKPISDTTPEAADVQREVWRRMTAEQRDEVGAQLSENVRTIAAEGGSSSPSGLQQRSGSTSSD